VHSVFAAAPNVAITAFGAGTATSATQAGEAYLEVANFAPDAQDVHLTLTRGTAVIVDKTVTMAAGEAVRQVAPLAIEGDPRLRARISAPRNALDVDDEAAAWLRSAEPLAVTIVSPDAGALALLLQRDPSIRLTLVNPVDYQPGRADVVVFDRWLPASAPGVPVLAIAPPPSSWLGAAGTEERTPRWTGTGVHPVVAGVDPLTLDLKRARPVSSALVTVASSEQGTPLVAVSDQATARYVVLSFALADSNLSTSPAFPVLIGNALEWLARPSVSGTGQPGPIALPASTTRVLDGDGTSVPVVRVGDRAVATLGKPGLYRIESGASHSVVSVNVGSPEISNLMRTPAAAAGMSTAGRFAGRPWWMYAVLLAFVLAGVEWWTWQRRITV
jgi:hypothetical protein